MSEMLTGPKKIVDGLTEVFRGLTQMCEGMAEQIELLEFTADDAAEEDKLLPPAKLPPVDTAPEVQDVPHPRKKPVKRPRKQEDTPPVVEEQPPEPTEEAPAEETPAADEAKVTVICAYRKGKPHGKHKKHAGGYKNDEE